MQGVNFRVYLLAIDLKVVRARERALEWVQMEEAKGFAEELRALRQARRLSVSELSAFASVARSSIANWESGSHVPRGAALGRLLDALEADDRTRARLMQACDPAHARIALASTRLGAPIGVGAVIRGMRARREVTQADLSRAVNATQATVARWESGALTPSAQTLHAVGFALGASAEETVALAQTQGAETPIPERFEEAHQSFIWRLQSHALTEVMALGLEAELWRRAVRDPRWEAHLCSVLSIRAARLYVEGRFSEVEAPARQAVRLASTPEARIGATHAVGALAGMDRHRNAPPEVVVRAVGAWIERLPDSTSKAWMMAIRAWRLGAMGRAEEAVDEVERASTMVHRSVTHLGSLYDLGVELGRRSWLCDVHLEAARPDRAEALLDARYAELTHGKPTEHTVRVGHALGRSAPAEAIEALRPRPSAGLDPFWTEQRNFGRIEREQRRLLAAGG